MGLLFWDHKLFNLSKWTFWLLDIFGKWKQMETFGNKKKCPFFGFKNCLTGLHDKSLEVHKKVDCIAPFCSFLLLLLLFKTLREPWGQPIEYPFLLNLNFFSNWKIYFQKRTFFLSIFGFTFFNLKKSWKSAFTA